MPAEGGSRKNERNDASEEQGFGNSLKIKPADVAILIAMAFVSAYLVFAAFKKADGKPEYVNIRTVGSAYVYPLSKNAQYEFEGKRGAFIVECDNRVVRVIHADCPEGICMRKSLSEMGDSIVCLPNMVTVWLSHGASGDADSPVSGSDANGGIVDDVAY
ncbi:MAG TPA: hypothetical protein DCO86_01885 [Spirochaetaceae bacterium]|nr:hypothetical protein [Spirochaetaceae bacterium]